MTAEKGNKVYSIDESMKARYLSDGFDIYEDGKILEYGTGKTVEYKEYVKLMEENEALKKKIAELEENSGESTKTKKAGAKGV
jgi:cell division protein FtsB